MFLFIKKTIKFELPNMFNVYKLKLKIQLKAFKNRKNKSASKRIVLRTFKNKKIEVHLKGL